MTLTPTATDTRIIHPVIVLLDMVFDSILPTHWSYDLSLVEELTVNYFRDCELFPASENSGHFYFAPSPEGTQRFPV